MIKYVPERFSHPLNEKPHKKTWNSSVTPPRVPKHERCTGQAVDRSHLSLDPCHVALAPGSTSGYYNLAVPTAVAFSRT